MSQRIAEAGHRQVALFVLQHNTRTTDFLFYAPIVYNGQFGSDIHVPPTGSQIRAIFETSCRRGKTKWRSLSDDLDILIWYISVTGNFDKKQSFSSVFFR